MIYRHEGIVFTCFHNKAHPEKWSRLPRDDYTAMMEMAVIGDLAAKSVFDAEKGNGVRPDLPGQGRFALLFQGKEVVGPLRKNLKKITLLGYSAKYITNLRHNGNLSEVLKITEWNAIERFHKSQINVFSPTANAKYLYQRWATNYFQVKVGILAADEDKGLCTCGEVETMWHLLGSCKANGLCEIRRRFSDRRIAMMQKIGIQASSIEAIVSMAELKSDDTYLDWNVSAQVDAVTQGNIETLKWLKASVGYHSNWFQRGPLRTGAIQKSRVVLGVDSRAAEKFALEWFASKRNEGDAIWKRRNDVKHGNSFKFGTQLGELKKELRDLIFERKAKGWDTEGYGTYAKMSRNEIIKCIAEYKDEIILEESRQRRIFDFFGPDRSEESNANGNDPAESARINTRITSRRLARQKLSRAASATRAVENTPLINSIFDASGSVGVESVVDLNASTQEANEIRQLFMNNCCIDEGEFDEEAEDQIGILTQALMLDAPADGEI